jgi:hypothetical protein
MKVLHQVTLELKDCNNLHQVRLGSTDRTNLHQVTLELKDCNLDEGYYNLLILNLLDEGYCNLLTLSLLDEGCYNRLTLILLDEGCYSSKLMVKRL